MGRGVRNSSTNTKVSEGEGRAAPGTRAEIPLQPMERTPLEHVDTSWRIYISQRTRAGAGLSGRTAAHRRSPHGSKGRV